MFLENKYYRWYMSIVTSNKIRIGAIETHHIIPKSMGGSNAKTNLVKLSPREHYICHLLLTKCVDKKFRVKMVKACYLMGKSRNITSRSFERLKLDFYESCKGPKNWSKEGLEKLSKLGSTKIGTANPFYGKSHTKEAKLSMGSKNVGKSPKNAKQVIANGKIYTSVLKCAKDLNISSALVIYRIRSDKYDYKYYTAMSNLMESIGS
jgi:hypothetical protein